LRTENGGSYAPISKNDRASKAKTEKKQQKWNEEPKLSRMIKDK